MYNGFDHHPEVGSEEEKISQSIRKSDDWNLD
jgi:hypothetical protein